MVIPVLILLFIPTAGYSVGCHPDGILFYRHLLILLKDATRTELNKDHTIIEALPDSILFLGLYVALLLYSFTLQSTFYILCGILFLLFALLLLALQPYKSELSWYTSLHAAFLILLVMLWFSLTGLSYVPHQKTTFLVFTLFCWISPAIYLIFCVLRWLFI